MVPAVLRHRSTWSPTADSILAAIGKLSLGFQTLLDDWRVSTALITGFMAKEAVISTLGVLVGTDISNLGTALGTMFTPPTAVSFLVFTLLYTPCVAAVAAIKRELRSGVQAVLLIIAQCAVAWIAAFAARGLFRLIL